MGTDSEEKAASAAVVVAERGEGVGRVACGGRDETPMVGVGVGVELGATGEVFSLVPPSPSSLPSSPSFGSGARATQPTSGELLVGSVRDVDRALARDPGRTRGVVEVAGDLRRGDEAAAAPGGGFFAVWRATMRCWAEPVA